MSSFENPVVISCSISGVIANRDQCPAIPYTPEEYAAEARRAVDEGASQIHIHARTPDHELVSAWLEDLLDCTCPVAPVLIGHTLGGAIAARFAVEHSERLAALPG